MKEPGYEDAIPSPLLRVLCVELSKGQKALLYNSEYTSPTGKTLNVLGKAKKGCLVLGLLGTLTLGSAVAQAAPMDRSLSLYNIHTKENLSITYKRSGKYDRKALNKINWFMRDWRNNQTIKMDPKLIDLMWEVHQDLGSKKPIHIVSSYRSMKTNNMLRRKGRKVARNSQHTKGKAVDVYFPDITSKQIRENALIRELGGVGYYPRSLSKGFVHLDTGSVRHWPRMHARTFAKLFPNGKSKHRPRSYPSKAMYAKYRGKTPERHIQMALASKSGNTPDVRLNQSIQLAALKPKKSKPVLVEKNIKTKDVKPTGPAPIVLTSAKILEEKTQPITPQKQDDRKVTVQQLASLSIDTKESDPLNKPVNHGLKPVEIASLEPVQSNANNPANAPLAHGLKPVEVASSMDVKIIPVSAKPGEKEQNIKPKLPNERKTTKIDVASLDTVVESDTVKDPEMQKAPTKKLPPVNIAFSQASLIDLAQKQNIKMPKVNRAIKGDLLMTNFYKKAPKEKTTASLSGRMGDRVHIELTLSWEDNTELYVS